MRIASGFKTEFELKQVNYIMKSELDHGIYDAMNKGATLASGEWILMLNAGDVFFSSSVLQNIFENKNYSEDVIYGNTIVSVKDSFYKKYDARDIKQIKKNMPFCHQSVFVRADVLKKYLFNERYKLAADYDFFLKLYLEGKKFCKVDEFVSIYDGSGVSETNFLLLKREYYIIKKNNKLKISILKELMKFIEDFISNLKGRVLKKVAPNFYYSKKRGWNNFENDLNKNI